MPEALRGLDGRGSPRLVAPGSCRAGVAPVAPEEVDPAGGSVASRPVEAWGTPEQVEQSRLAGASEGASGGGGGDELDWVEMGTASGDQQHGARVQGQVRFVRHLALFRHYFQHPWLRLFIAYLVTLLNFLMFAEDPVSHSRTEANVAVVGNCFSLVVNKYPGGWWSVLKVCTWLCGIAGGMLVGKFIIHQALFGNMLRLKMFHKDRGTWMVMFFTSIMLLFFFSHIYNLLLTFSPNMTEYIVSDYMGLKNENFMRGAALGTWMGDSVTAWMVTDMMLQDTKYPAWAKSLRCFWRRGNNRIIVFWVVWLSLTSLVVLVVCTDWISWDAINHGFLPSNEVSRAFLASFILVFDLLIVMQDWEFPHFIGAMDVKLPGLHTSHIQLQLPRCIFREVYHIHITGKWFNYGIIILVLILDLNMWKNQIFYKPYEYGQYLSPSLNIYTVTNVSHFRAFNASTFTWEWRTAHVNPDTNRTYTQGDLFMFSKFVDTGLSTKCLAFLPSLLAFTMFGIFVVVFGRFKEGELLPGDVKMYQKVESVGFPCFKTMLLTRVPKGHGGGSGDGSCPRRAEAGDKALHDFQAEGDLGNVEPRSKVGRDSDTNCGTEDDCHGRSDSQPNPVRETELL
ncbi:transmembrane protein 117 isoform X1 [Petromyzon marinus]|uniref:transmembrane protein 117 isoform X1 n=1 Tax=Petromyzon marinus TaxID=7757 RepID=UPI003F704E0F